MKHILTFGLFLFLTLKSFAQTDGISYQAVIIAPDVLELPGVNSEGNYLPNATVIVRFIIFDSGNQIEFQEDQTATTDDFGRINLIIGAVNHDDFEKISWDGTPKDLKVEIDFQNGSSFVDMSREILTFVPYAYHRNITATGTLDVDGDTFLNRELTVNGPTTLNSTLLVSGANETNLTGDLSVDGVTNLNNDLNVNNQSTTNLSGALNVGVATGLPDPNAPTVLNGDLTVVGQSAFTGLTVDDLTVNIKTLLKGDVDIDTDQQVVINSTVSTGGDKAAITASGKQISNYPLLVQGSNHGIAIKVNNKRSNANNFVSFWDDDYLGSLPMMWGRIEGELPSEFPNNADWKFDQSSMDFDIYDSKIDLGFAIANSIIADLQLIKSANDYRGCFGVGGCLASPGPLDIAFAVAEVISAAAQAIFADNVYTRAKQYKANYDASRVNLQGVTYASGAGDYAEYLLKQDLDEDISYGDIVGVFGGKVSKTTLNAERLMVVSFKPIVLGNMPQPNRENEYEKVAFMGQVPVKVLGKVQIGDYILPSGRNDGLGIAVNPSHIKLDQIKDIVGKAWSTSDNLIGVNMVNVVVGLNVNDSNPFVEKLQLKVVSQSKEIANLKNQIAEIYEILSSGQNNKQSPEKTNQSDSYDDYSYDRKYEIIEAGEGEIVFWEITMEDLENGLKIAKEQMMLNGIDIENNEVWKKITEDPNYKKEMLSQIKSRIDKQFHYHKQVAKEARH